MATVASVSWLLSGRTMRGTVLLGGSDWMRPDGVTTLNVRVVLETDDKALIGMTYRGLRHGPPSAIERLARGEAVGPPEFYFRTSVAFETASTKYDWLNRIIAIGTGQRRLRDPSTIFSRCYEGSRRASQSVLSLHWYRHLASWHRRGRDTRTLCLSQYAGQFRRAASLRHRT
jgi:hypothetical protein